MKQNNKLIVNISSEDKKKLKKTAEDLGLTLNQYCLLVLKNAKPINVEYKFNYSK